MRNILFLIFVSALAINVFAQKINLECLVKGKRIFMNSFGASIESQLEEQKIFVNITKVKKAILINTDGADDFISSVINVNLEGNENLKIEDISNENKYFISNEIIATGEQNSSMQRNTKISMDRVTGQLNVNKSLSITTLKTFSNINTDFSGVCRKISNNKQY